MSNWTPFERATAKLILGSRWIPQDPTAKQLEFLARPEREVLYGGAAGPGKSSALLMGSLMFADIPSYSAIIFRKTYTDLSLPGALMDRAAEWLGPTVAKWNSQDKKWTFPSGATLQFGYLDGPNDKFRYQSAEFQYIGMDEATQIREADILYMSSRLRRLAGSVVPLRKRYASNPGGESHAFFAENFVDPRVPNPERAFVPGLLEDNPHLDTTEYELALADLDETTYRQLRLGQWIEYADEAAFKREWYEGQNRYTPDEAQRMWNACVGRYIALDTANTAEETSAYNAMVVGDVQRDYRMPIRHVERERLEFPELVDWTVEKIAPFYHDYKLKAVFIEYAASGMQLTQTLLKSGPKWLRPLIVPVKPWSGSKTLPGKHRAWKAASVWWKRGMVLLPEPTNDFEWQYDFERELFSVPNSTYKDQADGAAMLTNELEKHQHIFSTRWRALQRQAEQSGANVA